MEIIAELEPTARGAYCGSLGYLGFDGSLDTSILIRTITAGRGWWQVPVGGGIVAQSVPSANTKKPGTRPTGLLPVRLRLDDQTHMILLIDNYDSFVFNLARYFERLGQTTRVVRNDAIDVGGVAALRPAAIVLSPGPCTPNEAGCSLDVVRQLAGKLPILGVCLGHQAIGAALGGADRARRRAGARPHVADLSRRARRVCRPAESAHRLPLSFAGGRASDAARMLGSDGLDGRRHDHGA